SSSRPTGSPAIEDGDVMTPSAALPAPVLGPRPPQPVMTRRNPASAAVPILVVVRMSVSLRSPCGPDGTARAHGCTNAGRGGDLTVLSTGHSGTGGRERRTRPVFP